ncbi:MAG TPA: hypothetical protein VIR16_10235 [Candidatus Limnocylindrales bacterium]
MKRKSWATVLITGAICLAFAGPASAGDPSLPFAGFTRPGVDVSTAPVGCPDGSMWRYSSHAEGLFTHLGLVDFSITHCSSVDLATGAGTFVDGTITITAANGDALFLAEHGTFQVSPWPNPARSDIQLVWVVSGGTGRFANASGSGGATALGDLAAGSTVSWFRGTISY